MTKSRGMSLFFLVFSLTLANQRSGESSCKRLSNSNSGARSARLLGANHHREPFSRVAASAASPSRLVTSRQPRSPSRTREEPGALQRSDGGEGRKNLTNYHPLSSSTCTAGAFFSFFFSILFCFTPRKRAIITRPASSCNFHFYNR